jgi:thiosulfate/3-mercaptopyruvate sulfurtransferase
LTDLAYTTLISPRELALLARSGVEVAILDCRHDLARTQWGAQAYAEGHIAGAEHAHLDRDLSAPVTDTSGRHPLPDPQALAATFTRWGIGRGTQVVAYDQANGAIAARLWWLLRLHGHDRVAVLDGGLAGWQAAGLPLTQAPVRARRLAAFEHTPALESVVSTSELEAQLGQPQAARPVLIDARAADRFAGRNETLDPVAGHIPGARNHPFTRNVEDGRFLAPEALRRSWGETLAGTPASKTVAMCGSGVTACHNLLAMRIAQLGGARLYAGSWSEWVRDPARPVERG